MDSSTTPRLGPRGPPLAESTVISSSRISPASCSSSAIESRLTWSGESIKSRMRGIVSEGQGGLLHTRNPDTEVHVLHFLICEDWWGGQSCPVAVGMPVARHPPHRSVRALLTHTVLTSDVLTQSAPQGKDEESRLPV